MRLKKTGDIVPSRPTAESADDLWRHPGVVRLGRLARRVVRFDRATPLCWDVAVVVAVFLVSALPDQLRRESADYIGDNLTRPPTLAMIALQTGLILPLLWRRRMPFVAFAVIATAFILQWSIAALLHADVALFIALFNVALHSSLRRLPWAYAVTLAGLAFAAVRVSARDPLISTFFLLSAATAAAALGLAVRVWWSYSTALREHARRTEIERDQRARLAAAAERSRVAREMHDIVGHNLSVIIGLADGGAAAAATAPEQSRTALSLIADTGRQAMTELRRMLGILQDEPATAQLSPQPGITDLDLLCERLRAAGPTVTYRSVGDRDTINPGLQLAIYRIIQESFTNTLKHTGTDTDILLTLAMRDRTVSLRVEDTGPRGGSAHPVPPTTPAVSAFHDGTGGHGLPGIRARAALYGGTVTAGPRNGGGWTVSAVLTSDPAPEDDLALGDNSVPDRAVRP